LRETLALELHPDKTLINHDRTRAARFLGYQITVQHSSTRLTKGRRTVNGKVALQVPKDVITAKCAPYRHIVNYYLLARNVWRLATLRWNAETSMLKTLAAKHKSTVATMAARHKAKVITGDGPRTCFEARLQRTGKKDLIARFGGIVLKRDKRAVITDPAPVPVHPPRKELIDRLRRRWCELCDHGATVTVHHIARLAQLGKSGPGQPAWAALMARKRRKTLIVCRPCHDYIHANPVANAA